MSYINRVTKLIKEMGLECIIKKLKRLVRDWWKLGHSSKSCLAIGSRSHFLHENSTIQSINVDSFQMNSNNGKPCHR